MTLRSRFTLAVAGAVAAVALAITAVAFLVVRADLTSQMQHELRQQAAVVERLAGRYHGHIPAGWVPRDSGRFGATSAYAQMVTASGQVRAPAGDGGLLPASAAAAQVAAGQRGSYYTETTLNGVRAMVLTTPVAPGLAVQLAVPLSAVDQELGNIGATLVLLSAAGVGLAALAGWGVARAGLAPVGRLAAVAEQVTATGDPGRRVEVDRADELGRLAGSFNTMLGALQRSLAAQRQLVSDASHELRTPLTSLRVNAELLAAEPGLPEAERREVLNRVVAQVAELGQLVADVTELARGEAPDGVAFAVVDFAEVVAAALEGARRDCAGSRLRGGPRAVRGLGRWGAAEDRRPQHPGQRGQVQSARDPGGGAPARWRAHRARPRTGDPARRPAARVRPLLPGGVGPRRARVGPRAGHRPPGGRRPRRDGPGRDCAPPASRPRPASRARRRDADPVARPARVPEGALAGSAP